MYQVLLAKKFYVTTEEQIGIMDFYMQQTNRYWYRTICDCGSYKVVVTVVCVCVSQGLQTLSVSSECE